MSSTQMRRALILLISSTGAAAVVEVKTMTRCKPFKSTLNGTNCHAVMKREKSAETSPDACRQLCCDSDCGAWNWHIGAAQCFNSPTPTDVSTCTPAHNYIGESRHSPPPPPPVKPCVTRKRGYSGYLGNEFTCRDMAALNLQDSWWYNWIVHPSQYSKCKPEGSPSTYNNMGAEYVPMINGIKALPPSGPWKKEWPAANVHFLLGYNEPDPSKNHPHACSPKDAAQKWPEVQAVAASMMPPLRLVSPSVSSTGWTADGESEWLDQFFGNCSDQTIAPGCNTSLIEFIGLHDYTGNATALMRRLNGAQKHYGGRQIWITEFAILGKPWLPGGHTENRSDQNAFMKEVLPLLDASDAVFRYAWFTSRNVPNAQNGGSNLLPNANNGTTPTSTGEIYKVKAVLEV